MMPIVEARRRDTKEVVRIPDHWLGHPTLGEPFIPLELPADTVNAEDAPPIKDEEVVRPRLPKGGK